MSRCKLEACRCKDGRLLFVQVLWTGRQTWRLDAFTPGVLGSRVRLSQELLLSRLDMLDGGSYGKFELRVVAGAKLEVFIRSFLYDV